VSLQKLFWDKVAGFLFCLFTGDTQGLLAAGKKNCLMNYSRKTLLHFFLIAVLFVIFIQLTEATTTNFTLHGGDEEVRSLKLAVEDRVFIRFTVIGQTTSNVRFYITCPNSTVREFGEVGDFSYSFVCGDEGDYSLHFINSSEEDKLVTLDYEVQHYVFGMPQMLFLTIIIVWVSVGAIAVFVLMGKTR
jgi:hypothetical protein